MYKLNILLLGFNHLTHNIIKTTIGSLQGFNISFVNEGDYPNLIILDSDNHNYIDIWLSTHNYFASIISIGKNKLDIKNSIHITKPINKLNLELALSSALKCGPSKYNGVQNTTTPVCNDSIIHNSAFIDIHNSNIKLYLDLKLKKLNIKSYDSFVDNLEFYFYAQHPKTTHVDTKKIRLIDINISKNIISSTQKVLIFPFNYSIIDSI